MAARFLVGQPSVDMAEASASLLRSEAAQHGDLIFIPGLDTYRNLPNKSLRLLQYALSSPCNFTHIAKIDDDVYLRPHKAG